MSGFYNIYKNNQYSQTRIDDYVLWVKKIGLQVCKGSTPIYAISKKIKIDTPDGPMLSVKVCDDVVNPNYEPIAEVTINNIVYYILDDYLYAVGTRSKVNSYSGVSPRDSLVRQFHYSGLLSTQHSRVSSEPIKNVIATLPTVYLDVPSWTLKMVIYKIGEDPIF